MKLTVIATGFQRGKVAAPRVEPAVFRGMAAPVVVEAAGAEPARLYFGESVAVVEPGVAFDDLDVPAVLRKGWQVFQLWAATSGG